MEKRNWSNYLKMEVLESEMEALDHQMNECQSDFAKLKELWVENAERRRT